ncbi:MAG: hypothetical protein IPK60_21635 [Sandaracinaceae bacterium]|nr:hypothetical protein [Sandaracinaceae bacterium]
MAHADEGWGRRWLPNVGLIVTRDSANEGNTRGTGIGLEGTYTYFIGSLAPVPDSEGMGMYQSAFRTALDRLLTVEAGFFAQAELANAFGSPDSIQPRFSIGGQAGGFLGVELGFDYRAPGNGWAGTGSFHVAPFLSLGAFSVALRIPTVSFKFDGSDRAPFDEELTVVVKIAPLPLLAMILDWDTVFNPESGDDR